MSFIWSEALFLLFLALLNLLLIHCADLVLMKKTASLRSLWRVRFFHSPVSVARVGSADSDGLPCETRFEQSFINRLMRCISLARLPASIMSEGCILLHLTKRKILSNAFSVPLPSRLHIPLSKTSLKVSIIPAAFRCHSKLWVPPVHLSLCVLSPALPFSCPSSLGVPWSPPSDCFPRFAVALLVHTSCTTLGWMKMKVIHFGSFSHLQQSWMSEASPALLNWKPCHRRGWLSYNMLWVEDPHF